VVIPKNVQQRIANQESIFEVIVERKNQDYLALSPYLQGTARSLIQTDQTLSSQKLGKDSLSEFLKEIHSMKGVKLEQTIVQKNGNENQSAITLMFVGFAIMFMMFGLSGAASAILDEKEEGTWGRLLVSPISKFQIISGYLLSYFIMGWIQMAVIMIAMNVMFHTDWGNLFYLIPFASLVILCVVGFSLMIAGLVKTKAQAAAIGAVLIVSTCMLGGVYWSIDLVPEVMKKISMGVPQSWAMAGFKEIVSGSLNGKTLLNDTMALIGFTVAFFFIGLKRMKFE
jgi:ABC-2 type transport system permease protein